MEKGFCEIDISRLVKAGWNYKENNDELSEKLANNIKRNGQIENIIIRELDTGFFEVVNGNHRLDVLDSIGFNKIFCFNLGKISEAQAKRIAIETNETKFSTNEDILSTIMKELSVEFDDIDLTMPFSEEEMFAMLKDIEDVNIDEDDFEEVEEDDFDKEETEEPITEPGDLYELNGHRLICGDCTDKEVIDRLFDGKKANLVVTDPPYGVDYGKKNERLNDFEAKDGKKRGTRMERDIENDAIEDYRKFFAAFMSIIPFAETNSFYAFISSQNLHNLRLAFDDSKMYFSSILVWLKNQHVISWIDYMSKIEFVMYGWKGRHKFYGANNSMNVFEFDKPIVSKLHPTMKPVELIKKIVSNSSLKGEIVYDAFLGSGTTIIASQELDRICYGTELSAHYCDVIAIRFAKYMKKKGLEYSIKRNGIEISQEEWLNKSLPDEKE
jgi:DNA modification methylase